MAIVTGALLTNLFVSFSAAFKKGFGSVDPMWNKIAMRVQSTSKSNTYGWLGNWPGFREWVGDRVVKSMKAHEYSIVNKDWESTVGVSKNDIEDDEIGIYSPMFEEMGRASSVFPDELVFGLLQNGFSTLCYDGQNFFDTDHPVFPEVDGTGVAITASNMQAGAATPWFLLDTSRSLKPIIYQERKKPQFVRMDRETDETMFTNKQAKYGVDCRSNVGFGLWQLAFGSKAELNKANLDAAIASMQGRKADGGRPMGVNPTLLVVPPTLRSTALELVKAERNAAGATNVNRNAVEVLVTPYIEVPKAPAA